MNPMPLLLSELSGCLCKDKLLAKQPTLIWLRQRSILTSASSTQQACGLVAHQSCQNLQFKSVKQNKISTSKRGGLSGSQETHQPSVSASLGEGRSATTNHNDALLLSCYRKRKIMITLRASMAMAFLTNPMWPYSVFLLRSRS